jgi:hypothetical protein
MWLTNVLALLVDGADCSSIGLGDDEHPWSMDICTDTGNSAGARDAGLIPRAAQSAAPIEPTAAMVLSMAGAARLAETEPCPLTWWQAVSVHCQRSSVLLTSR